VGRRRGETNCAVDAGSWGKEGWRRYVHGRDGGEVALIHGKEVVW